MRIPDHAHTARPWRIRELTSDFRLEDAWELPGTGRAEDFPRLVERLASFDPARGTSLPVRTLFVVRERLGSLFGWDHRRSGVGGRVATLRDRMPIDLRDAPRGPAFEGTPFTSLYLLDDEWAAEAANETMHGVLHLGLVRDRAGRHRVQLAVYVKPNGLLGRAYMAGIRPFRHLLVYPELLRTLAQMWRSVGEEPAAPLSAR